MIGCLVASAPAPMAWMTRKHSPPSSSRSSAAPSQSAFSMMISSIGTPISFGDQSPSASR